MVTTEKSKAPSSRKRKKAGQSQIETFQAQKKTLNENLKKALTEFLVLNLLSIDKMPVCQILTDLSRYSENAIELAFPYPILYRLMDEGFIVDMGKSKSFDGRRRQVFMISDEGRRYLAALRSEYESFISGANQIVKQADLSKETE